MNLSAVNTIAFKTVSIMISIMLIVLTVVIAMHHLYVKAGIALVSAAITGMLSGNKPAFISWLLMLGTFLLSVYIVGLLDK